MVDTSSRTAVVGDILFGSTKHRQSFELRDVSITIVQSIISLRHGKTMFLWRGFIGSHDMYIFSLCTASSIEECEEHLLCLNTHQWCDRIHHASDRDILIMFMW